MGHDSSRIATGFEVLCGSDDCNVDCGKGWKNCANSTITAKPTTEDVSIHANGGYVLQYAEVTCPQRTKLKNKTCNIYVGWGWENPLADMNP